MSLYMDIYEDGRFFADTGIKGSREICCRRCDQVQRHLGLDYAFANNLEAPGSGYNVGHRLTRYSSLLESTRSLMGCIAFHRYFVYILN